MKDLSLKEKYTTVVAPAMKAKFGYKSEMATPKIKKIVVNVGTGRMSQQANFTDKLLPAVVTELAAITGQKPRTNKSTKSIAGFKMREGTVVGVSVTLRGARMYDFLDKINKIVFPRVRDFKGLETKGIDAGGNLNIGLKEHTVFPEINPENAKADFGVQITVVANIEDREEAVEFYRLMGVPLKS
jgi:large subunit ribosomal protein L5